MPINKKNKILFIHIPKTAGTSIETFFNMHHKGCFFQKKHSIEIDGIKFCPQHLRYKDLKKRLDNIERFFSFSFVRHPYDRIISEFFYKKELTRSRKKNDINKWVKNFIENNNDDHSLPQHEFIFDENENVLVDFLGKYENLNKDFNELLNKLGYNNNKLPNKKISKLRKKRNFNEYLSNESKELIYEKYKKDFDIFNYKS